MSASTKDGGALLVAHPPLRRRGPGCDGGPARARCTRATCQGAHRRHRGHVQRAPCIRTRRAAVVCDDSRRWRPQHADASSLVRDRRIRPGLTAASPAAFSADPTLGSTSEKSSAVPVHPGWKRSVRRGSFAVCQDGACDAAATGLAGCDSHGRRNGDRRVLHGRRDPRVSLGCRRSGEPRHSHARRASCQQRFHRIRQRRCESVCGRSGGHDRPRRRSLIRHHLLDSGRSHSDVHRSGRNESGEPVRRRRGRLGGLGVRCSGARAKPGVHEDRRAPARSRPSTRTRTTIRSPHPTVPSIRRRSSRGPWARVPPRSGIRCRRT